jgi:hypothetical protein
MGAAPVAPVVPTVEAVVVVGWMEREPAINFLMNECVFDPPLTPERAEEIWARYHQAVAALPERNALAPQRIPMNGEEQRAAAAFMQFHRGSPNIREVIKIDPSNLITYQTHVIIPQMQRYALDAITAARYARYSLGTARGNHNIQIHHALNMMDIAVPHGEFAFIFNQQTNQFQVLEQARHISVTAFGDRMLLWAGYHRSYARIASANPDAMDRSLLVALTTDADFLVSPHSPNQGLRAMVTGLRPTFFRDFFDDTLFMRVNLKRKRFVLQVRAQIAPVDDV